MKPFTIFLFITLFVFNINLLEAQDNAQQAYENGEFKKAIELYEKEIELKNEKKEISSDIFYNLGNAYFRVNELPKAILNYERALLYAPGDGDIKHNIEYANTKIEDKILTANNFFLTIWFNGLKNMLSSNSWAKLAITSFLLFIIALFLYSFNKKLLLKKIGFYSGIIFLIVSIFSHIFAVSQKKLIENKDFAIVMAGSAPVVSSPNSEANELFILHGGTKLRIKNKSENWYEIEIADGSVGWIPQDKIEMI